MAGREGDEYINLCSMESPLTTSGTEDRTTIENPPQSRLSYEETMSQQPTYLANHKRKHRGLGAVVPEDL